MKADHSTQKLPSAVPVDPAAPATPEPTPSVVPSLSERNARQTEVVQALLKHLPAHTLLWHTEDTTPYECDGLTAYREQPLVVALPETEAQVAALLRACHALDVPVVARGAGTGLSGGAGSARSLRCVIAGIVMKWPLAMECRPHVSAGSPACRPGSRVQARYESLR